MENRQTRHELKYCRKCNQMTNHIKNDCLKCALSPHPSWGIGGTVIDNGVTPAQEDLDRLCKIGKEHGES